MPSCAVALCNNTHMSKVSHSKLTFHRFPVNKDFRSIWLHKCKRKDKINTKNAVVCSKHFQDDDFIIDKVSEVLGMDYRRKLKPGTIPSINLPLESMTTKKRRRRLECSTLSYNDAGDKTENTHNASQTQGKSNLPLEMDDGESVNASNSQGTSCHIVEGENLLDAAVLTNTLNENKLQQIIASHEKKIQSLEKKVQILEKKLNNKDTNILQLEKRHEKLQTKYLLLKCCEKRLNSKISQMESSRNSDSIKSKDKKILKNIKSIMTESQIKLLSGAQNVQWKSIDIAKSLSLAAISKKAYHTLRDVWKIPLPCTSTLHNWARKLNCENGLLKDVFHILKAEGQFMNNFEKLCSICFDEMSLNSSVVWDVTKDMIIGPHKKVQVIFLRGLCHKWEQPFYFDLDQNVTKSLLLDLICKLESVSFKVVAIVNDLGGNNQQLLNELNISISKTNFENPYDRTRKIEVFADPPHMIKLLRNHMLDQGLILPLGTLVSKAEVEELLKYDNRELQVCPKLTQSILDVKGSERMKVAPAVKLLSHQSATLSKYCFPNKPEIATFFSTFDDFFDLFNSRIPRDNDKEIRSAYGAALEKQNATLTKIFAMTKNMRVRFYSKKLRQMVARKGLLPFQKGILISITSLKNLLAQVREQFDVTYIITKRLNQDPLESLFSVIRSLGRTHDTPSPYDFKNRLKIVLLGSKVKSPVGSNVTFDDDHMFYMSRKLLEFSNNEQDDTPLVINENPTCQLKRAFDEIPLCDESEVSHAALTYLAGYLAFVVKRKYKKEYGTNTRKHNELIPSEVNSFVSPPTRSIATEWIEQLSRGGLMIPSKELLDWVYKCENIFRANFSEIALKNVPGITTVIVNKLSEAYPEVNELVIKEFTKTRLRIRIKYWNNFKARNFDDKVYNRQKKVKKAKQFLKSK